MDINWLNQQKLKICNSDDAVLFNEVISCYNNKLYRSGYLLAWILLIESLKRKIMRLTSLDDARAKIEWSKIEKMEKAHNSTDYQIAVSSKECEIITDTEFTILNCLWQSRCIYAHPYMQEVDSSDLEHIISKLINITLSKPLLYSQKNITDAIDKLNSSPYIIPSKRTERLDFIHSKLKLIKPKHYVFLYKTLFFNLSKLYDNRDFDKCDFYRLFILELFDTEGVDINSFISCFEKHIESYPDACWVAFFVPRIWLKIGTKNQDDLFRYIKITSHLNCRDAVLLAHKLLSTCDDISPDNLLIYEKKLEDYSLLESSSLYIDKNKFIENIETNYIFTNKYADQGEFVDYLETVNSLSDLYDDGQTELLGKFLGVCYLNNTFKAISFLKNTHNNTWINNKNFCNGIIRSMTSRDANLYLSTNCLDCILNIFSQISLIDSEYILLKVEMLSNDKASNDYYGYLGCIAQLKEKRESINNTSVFDRLSNIIKKYYAPAIKENTPTI